MLLDDYKEKQPIIYQIMKNIVVKQKISHAYLFDIKNCAIGNDMIISFVKYLLCPMKKNKLIECTGCIQCKKIDDSNYTELKIINPEGLWIKKEQLDELQEEFSKKPLEGNYKIYIINQVEKLNKYAANSLLKFLEEPEPGIIAILVTNNIYQVLETIRSRCQIFSFFTEKKTDRAGLDIISRVSQYIKQNDFEIEKEEEKEKYKNFINNIIHFIEYLEKNGKDILLYTTKLWHNNITEKNQILLAFDIMIFFYYDIINVKCDRTIKIFLEHKELLHYINEKNDMNNINRKINIIMKAKRKVKLNVNNGLLIDQLILDLLGGD